MMSKGEGIVLVRTIEGFVPTRQRTTSPDPASSGASGDTSMSALPPLNTPPATVSVQPWDALSGLQVKRVAYLPKHKQ